MCLGYLNPEFLAGGSLKVRHDLAAPRGRPSGRQCARPIEAGAAHGIRQIANANMARAIRSVTVERGKDPRGMT